MLIKKIGEAFRSRRLALRKTMSEVGAEAGCTRQNIYKIERAASNPSLKTLQQVAAALEYDLEICLIPRDPTAPRRLQMMRQVEEAPPELLLQLDQLAEAHKTKVLAGLLILAYWPEELAWQRAAREPDKPTSWDGEAERERLRAINSERPSTL